jgi:hypothetical protein
MWRKLWSLFFRQKCSALSSRPPLLLKEQTLNLRMCCIETKTRRRHNCFKIMFCIAYNSSMSRSILDSSTRHFFRSSDSSCGTHVRVPFLSPSSRLRISFTVGDNCQSVLTLLWHLRKDASQGSSWERVPKLWAVSLAEVDHYTINRRSWTFESTVSQPLLTGQNFGRYTLVLLWSFCFPIFSDGNTWQWISARICPWLPFNIRPVNLQNSEWFHRQKKRILFIAWVIWCISCIVSCHSKNYSLLLIFTEMEGWFTTFLTSYEKIMVQN